jgi:hypothetical protein
VASFDHLVGTLLENPRHIETECLGGLEIDDQLERGRRLNWQLAWPLAAQNTVLFVRMALDGISRKLGCVSRGMMNFCSMSLSVEKSYSGMVSRLTAWAPKSVGLDCSPPGVGSPFSGWICCCCWTAGCARFPIFRAPTLSFSSE